MCSVKYVFRKAFLLAEKEELLVMLGDVFGRLEKHTFLAFFYLDFFI